MQWIVVLFLWRKKSLLQYYIFITEYSSIKNLIF